MQINQTLSELLTLLRNIFTETMDRDTFAVVESMPSDQAFFSQYCVVVHGRPEPASHHAHSVIRAPSSRAVAVVDRTSDVEKAARELVRARFSFCGSSPYSPDIVLVNEFILEKFCSAAARYATENIGSNISDARARSFSVKSNSDLQKELQKSGATTLISGSRGSIVLVQDR